MNLVTEKAKEAGIGAAFLGGDFWDSPQLDLDAAEGSYFTNHYWQARKGRKCGPSKRHTIRNIRPRCAGHRSGLSYDAANLLLQAIQKAGRDDVASVRAALEGISFKGVSGTITFDAQHNAVKSATIVHVTGGKTVLDSYVSPLTPIRAKYTSRRLLFLP